jgi:hypothetical protein
MRSGNSNMCFDLISIRLDRFEIRGERSRKSNTWFENLGLTLKRLFNLFCKFVGLLQCSRIVKNHSISYFLFQATEKA